jgi:hypothetical protein
MSAAEKMNAALERKMDTLVNLAKNFKMDLTKVYRKVPHCDRKNR